MCFFISNAVTWAPSIFESINCLAYFCLKNYYPHEKDIDYELTYKVQKQYADFLIKHNIPKTKFCITKNSKPLIFSKEVTLINYVSITANLVHKDPDCANFYIKHELGHVKNRDSYLRNLVSLIVSVATGLIFTYLSSIFITCALPCILTNLTRFFLANLQERRADDFAIENSTNNELIAGAHHSKVLDAYYDKIISELNIFDSLKSFFEKLLDVHPNNYSRMKKIITEYERRTGSTMMFDNNRIKKYYEGPLNVFIPEKFQKPKIMLPLINA